jgi:hypothetical protein
VRVRATQNGVRRSNPILDLNERFIVGYVRVLLFTHVDVYWWQKQKAVKHASYLRPTFAQPPHLFILFSVPTNTHQYMMRLLNTTSLALSEFFGYIIPSYAILSHTWGSEEVSFQDIQGPHERILNWAGYKKIKDCCAKALEAGLKYVWIDTCCIDKTNSVELSEAINSMFRWYRHSLTCYAYLADVSPNDSLFATSRWFRRGGTLQELIAPDDVLFFDKYWNEIGTRVSLSVSLEAVTGVPQEVLLKGFQNHCISEIMSWAARRKTTRLEDRAYSLLGLFGVSMPLIYGEGEQAFTRLQLEIMKSSTDHSLFAWTSPEGFWHGQGVLARSPSEFRSPAGILRSVPTLSTSAYEMTNFGLRITLPCSKRENSTRELFAHLNCKVDGSDEVVGIWLKEVEEENGQYLGQFFRTRLDVITLAPEYWNEHPKSTSLYIIQPRSSLPPPRWEYGRSSTFSIDYSNLLKAGYSLEAYTMGHSLDTEVFSLEENRCSFLRNISFGLPFVIFFKHPGRAARVWAAISGNGETPWALIDGSIDKNNTPEVILKDSPIDKANKRWEDGEWVEHTLNKSVFEGETVSLTVKRAIIMGCGGFMVKMTVLDNKLDYNLGPRLERCRIPLREVMPATDDDPFLTIKKVS